MFLIESISSKIGHKVATILNLDNDHEEIMAYGAFCLIQILWSTLWIIVFGIIFNMLIEVIIVYFTVNILRKYSGGVHASSPGRCTIIGTTILVTIALIINKLLWMFNVYEILFCGLLSLIFSYYTVYKLAPVDSPSKPIIKMDTKKRFKKNSIIILNFFFVSMILILFLYFKLGNRILLNIITCMYLGILWQAFTLTSKSHKVLTKVDNILKNILEGSEKNEK